MKSCKRLIIFLIFLVSSVHSTPVITSTSPPSICNETSGGSTVYLTTGDTVTLSCLANNTGISNIALNIMVWTLPDTSTLTITNTLQADSNDKYVASLTSIDNTMGMETISSNITFNATQMDDETTISCASSVPGSEIAKCTLLVYTIPSVTTALTNTSVTYNSTTLSWTPPTDTGGYPTVNYIIEVTGSNNETIITTDNSIIYTNVECHQTYTFTVRANNSIGEGDPSNTVTVRIPCEVPPQPSNVKITCLNYIDDSISISWNCPVISNIDTTPPVTNYSISVNMVDTVTTSGPVCNYTLSLNGIESIDDITISVRANSIAGSSQPTSDTFNTELLQDVMMDGSSIKYSTVECLIAEDDFIVQLICDNITTSTVPYVTNITTSFILPSTTGMCTVQETIDTAISTTPTAVMMPSSSPTPTSTLTPTPSIAIYIGVGIVGVILIIILIVVVIIVIVAVCICYRKKSRTKVDLLQNGRGESSEPIPLVEKSIPETGQPTYQDPNTIERQAAPTGDLYAMPEKPKGRREPPAQPELATYQDPNTIQHQQAPTGDLYALPAQKPVYSEVNKDNKTQGVTYAPLMFDQQQPSSESTRSPPADVVYSDVQRYN